MLYMDIEYMSFSFSVDEPPTRYILLSIADSWWKMRGEGTWPEVSIRDHSLFDTLYSCRSLNLRCCWLIPPNMKMLFPILVDACLYLASGLLPVCVFSRYQKLLTIVTQNYQN